MSKWWHDTASENTTTDLHELKINLWKLHVLTMTRLTVFLYGITTILSSLRCVSSSQSSGSTFTTKSSQVSPSASVTSTKTPSATASMTSYAVTAGTISTATISSASFSSGTVIPTLSTTAFTGSQNVTSSSIQTSPPTSVPTTPAEGTQIWHKAIELATPLGTFIIVIVAVTLLLVFLIALIVVSCKYRNLKRKTRFPDHMAINDSEWIRSNDDLLMWERNLRASEVKTNNGISNRPFNEKRA